MWFCVRPDAAQRGIYGQETRDAGAGVVEVAVLSAGGIRE